MIETLALFITRTQVIIVSLTSLMIHACAIDRTENQLEPLLSLSRSWEYKVTAKS